MREEVSRGLARAFVATVFLCLAILLPLPPLDGWLFLLIRLPLAMIVFIVYMGRLIRDTFLLDSHSTSGGQVKALYVIGAIVLVALVVGGGFYGGIVYAQSASQAAAGASTTQRAGANSSSGQAAMGPCGFPQRANSSATPANSQSGRQGNFAQNGQCVARGQVKSVAGNTVQISTAVSVVTVKVDSTTTISKTDVGSLSDLQPGQTVTVYSRETGDSPTASVIQLQPAQGQPGQ